MSAIITEFDEQVEAAVASKALYVHDELIGVAWLDDDGQWHLGAPRTGRSIPVKNEARAQNLLRYYARHFEKTGVHGI